MRRVSTFGLLMHTALVPTEQIDRERLEELFGNTDPTHIGPGRRFGPPVSLRWLSHPGFGFPRAPFEVFRKPHIGKPDRRLHAGVTLSDELQLVWAGEMIEVQFQAQPDPGASLIIDAMDARGEPIPGQRILFQSSATGSFISQGIKSLRARGRGRILNIRGTEQLEFANRPDWQRIQVVGLPYQPGEVPDPVYKSNEPQGFEPSLTGGLAAALQRLKLGSLLTINPPATGIADIPTPVWPPIDPALFMSQLRDVSPSPMTLITRCLEQSDDSDPDKIQAKHTETVTIGGAQPIGSGGGSADPATAELPVTAITMLAVSGDGDTATGLGYGTLDLPPPIQTGEDGHRRPPGIVRPDFDYMVTATYVLPFFGSIELAALGVPRPPPTAAEGLSASTFLRNRPPGIDQPEQEAVQLRFALSPLPQGWAIAKSMIPGSVEVLNARRLLSPGFDPFIPQRASFVDGDPAADTETIFVDAATPVPLSGSETRRYIVAGLDVFHRFSPWQLVAHASTAPAIQQPGLDAVQLDTDVTTAVGHVVTGRLTIDFSWSWADRSPDRIVFQSRFFPSDDVTPPASAPGFAMNSVPAAPAAPQLVVRFDVSGAPSIDSSHSGIVETVAMNPPSTESRRYRVTIEGVRCDFTSRPELAVAVFARAAERIRPAQLSAPVGPRVAVAADPVPADNPTLPVEILWTALPDATRVARAFLTWTPSPGATGYFIWEATETALRAKLAPALPDPAPDESLVSRATTIRDLLNGPGGRERSLGAFTRLNERKIVTAQVELELPAEADSLYLYRISTITAAAVESARSDSFVIVAVPRTNIPGTPGLLLRARRDMPRGIQVIAFAGPGKTPAGYRVHRVNGKGPAGDVGRMGPPIVHPDTLGWADHAEPVRPGGPSETGRAYLDAVTPGWVPRSYRVVAVGAEDLANGEIQGESEPSTQQMIVLPPDGDPLLDDIELLSAAGGTPSHQVLNLRTDLPSLETPLGQGRLRIDHTTLSTDGMLREPVIDVDIATLPEGPPFDPNATLTPDELNTLPEARHTSRDALGHVVVSIRLPAEVVQGAITATDPLRRSSASTFAEEQI